MKYVVGVLGVALCLAGCPEQGSSKSESSAKPGSSDKTNAGSKAKAPGAAKGAATSAATAAAGAKTPKAAFEKLKKAANARQYRELFGILTPDSQDRMLIGQLFAAGLSLAPMGTKGKSSQKEELDKIFKKHGIKNPPSKAARGNPIEQMKRMRQELAAIKDRPGLFYDLMKYLESNNLRQTRYDVVRLEKLSPASGDKATGIMVLKGRANQPLEFRRIGGLWYVHMVNLR